MFGDQWLQSLTILDLNTLKRNNKVRINLYGESNDMTDEYREIIMSAIDGIYPFSITTK